MGRGASPEAARLHSFSFQNLLAAIVEQGLFSGSNFAVTIMLLRWMPADQAGAYSFGYSLFGCAAILFEALVADPIAIFGSDKYLNDKNEYMFAIICFHLVFCGAIASLLIVVILIVGYDNVIAEATIGAAVSAPMLLLRPVTQKICYNNCQNKRFALAGIAYLILVTVLLFCLHLIDILRPFSAFIAIGVSMAFPCLFIIRNHLSPKIEASWLRQKISGLWRDHWRYGCWQAVAELVHWLGASVFYLIGPSIMGLEATAGVRAIFNLLMPLSMTNVAIFSAVTPTLVRLRATGKDQNYRRFSMLLGCAVLSWSGAYSFMVFLGGAEVIRFAYRGTFDGLMTPWLIVWVAVIPLLSAFVGIFELEMRVKGKTRPIALSEFAGTASVLTVGLGACALFGLTGAFSGWALSYLVMLAVNIWWLCLPLEGAALEA